MRYSVLFPAIVAVATAAPATLTRRDVPLTKIDDIHQPGQCLPSGYFQAEDKGQPFLIDTVTKECADACADNSECHVIVVQTQNAGDTGLFTAQCFYYSSAPSPVTCEQGPSAIAGYYVGDSEPSPPPTCGSQQHLNVQNIFAANFVDGHTEFTFDLSSDGDSGCSTTCSATWQTDDFPSGPSYNCDDTTYFSLGSPNGSITEVSILFGAPGQVDIENGTHDGKKYLCTRGANDVRYGCQSSGVWST